MTLRAIHTVAASGEPEWMAAFLLSLERDDLAPATVRGYRYDLRHFLAWRRIVHRSRPEKIPKVGTTAVFGPCVDLHPSKINRLRDQEA